LYHVIKLSRSLKEVDDAAKKITVKRSAATTVAQSAAAGYPIKKALKALLKN
jgi:hypothetical protein